MQITINRCILIIVFSLSLSGCLSSLSAWNAIKAGDEQKAYSLVRSNSFNKYKIPGLIVSAAAENQTRIVEALMKQEDLQLAIDRISTGKAQMNPLYIAIHHDNTKMLEHLVRGGFKLNVIHDGPWTKHILKPYPEAEVEMNKLPIMGLTPLLFAIKQGKLKSVKALLDMGSSLSIHSVFGESPMFIAAKSGNVETMKFLLQQGLDITDKNSQGQSLLEYYLLPKPEGSKKPHANRNYQGGETIPIWTQLGAHPVRTPLFSGHSVIYGAVLSNNTAMLDFVLSQGASLTGDENGLNVLDFALLQDCIPSARYLIKKGLVPRKINSSNYRQAHATYSTTQGYELMAEHVRGNDAKAAKDYYLKANNLYQSLYKPLISEADDIKKNIDETRDDLIGTTSELWQSIENPFGGGMVIVGASSTPSAMNTIMQVQINTASMNAQFERNNQRSRRNSGEPRLSEAFDKFVGSELANGSINVPALNDSDPDYYGLHVIRKLLLKAKRSQVALKRNQDILSCQSSWGSDEATISCLQKL